MSWKDAPPVEDDATPAWQKAPEVPGGMEAAPVDLTWAETANAIPRLIRGGLKKVFGGMVQESTDDIIEQFAPSMAKRQGRDVEEVKRELYTKKGESGTWGAQLWKEGDDEVKATNLDEAVWYKRFVAGGVSSAALMVPGIAASAATKSMTPALGSAMAMARGESYGEAREAGLDPAARERYADINMVAEGLMEVIPTAFLLDKIKGPVLAMLPGFLIREVGTEVATTTINSVNAKFHTRPDMTVDEWLNDVIETAGSTLVAAPLLAGAGKIGSRLAPKDKEAATPVTEQPGFDPMSLASQGTELGAVFGELNDPNYDLPTTPLDAKEVRSIEEALATIDPEKLDDQMIEEERKVLASELKREKTKALPGAELAWAPIATAPTSAVEDAGELGASSRSTANAANYVNPNQGDRLDREFSFGPDGYVGLSPRQVLPVAGTYVLGKPSDDRPADYLQALHATVEQWRQQYIPQSTIVLSNEQLFSNSALGWHYTSGQGKHIIVPAVLRKASKGWGQYNPNTIATAFYNATHEFGHALISDRFYQGMEDAAVGQLRDASRKGAVPADLAMGMPEEQRAVVQEFNTVKARILNDQMTAEQFVAEWMGPAKIGRSNFLRDLKVSPKAPAKQLVNAIAERAATASSITQEEAKAAMKQELVEDMLSLDEYLAEQLTRFAYKKQWEQSTPLGRFFSETLRIMRQFFVDRKKDGTITPGTAFAEWMEGLGKTPRALEEPRRLAEAKQKTKTKAADPLKDPAHAQVQNVSDLREALAKVPKKRTKRVQHNVEADTTPVRTERAEKMVAHLVRSNVLAVSDPNYAKLTGFIKRAEWNEFVDLFTQVAGKTVKFEIKLDQYYTADSLAKAFVDWVKARLPDATEFVEPSAGTGAILKHLPDAKGYDIDPKAPGIEQADFLKTPLGYKKGRVFVGNPPFSLAKEFLTKSLQEGDYAALIMPLSFRRADYVKGIPGVIVDEIMLNPKERFVTEEGEKQIRTVAQIWRRGPIQPGYSGRKATPAQLAKIDKTELNQRFGGIAHSEKALHAAALGEISPLGGKGKLRYLPKANYEIDVTAEPDWPEGKFNSPGFKAWFGDWERDPEGSSKIRVGMWRQDGASLTHDDTLVSPPLVVFTTQARIDAGENVFHASTVRGQVFLESRSYEPVPDPSLVPVVLNMRNPFVVADLHTPAPTPAALQAQGYDGVVYRNDFDGDLSYVVFKPDQIKVVKDKSPYGRGSNVHMELDTDQSTPEGHGAARFYRAVKDWVKSPGVVRRALRHTLQSLRHAEQMQQIAQLNPDIEDATFFVAQNSEYVRYGQARMALPNKNLDFWEDTNNTEFENIAKFLRAQEKSGQRWFELTKSKKMREGKSVDWWELVHTSDTTARMREHGIDPEDGGRGAEVARHLLNVENSLLDDLNETQAVIESLLALRHGHSPRQLLAAVRILSAETHRLRQVPFLPHAWFGEYAVVVRRKRDGAAGYETIHKQAFDSAEERDKVFDKLNARRGDDEIVQKKELTDTQQVLMGLPADFLDTIATELDLRDEQVDKLVELLQPVRQEKLLKQRSDELLAISGQSEDVMRSYANYTWHHANALSKMLYRKSFDMAIGRLRRNVEQLSRTSNPDYYRQYGILRTMEGTKEYIMNPPNEWHAARTAVSLLYLAGNIKTALVNSFGLMLTWSDLTSRFGAVDGEKRFYQAAYWSTAAIRNPGLLPQQIREGLQRALEEGKIKQNYAAHLAGEANSNRLHRVLSRRRAIRYAQRGLDLTMVPFRLMEEMTRRITFISSLQENLENKAVGFEQAYRRAVAKTDALQNDYSRGNRPLIMRGTKGTGGLIPMMTIFLSFAQHAAFHSLGGYERGIRRDIRERIRKGELPAEALPKNYELLYGHTARLWALLFFLAGYEGLPFAENILDVVEAVWRRFGKRPIRQELRELVQGMQQDPHLWARGLSHNVMGFDLSRSVGFGRLFPGTDVLAKSQQLNANEHVGTMAFDMMGVTGHTIKWALDLSPMSNKSIPDSMKGAPGAIGNLWNAYYWGKYGVLGPNEGRIIRDPETGLLRDLTRAEILGKALGANPTAVSQEREIRYAQYDREVFWTQKANHLKEQVWRGVWQKDSELEREARQAIRDFNDEVKDDPDLKLLRIQPGDVSRFIQRKRQARRKEEAAQPRSRKMRGLYEDVRRSHDAPVGDTE